MFGKFSISLFLWIWFWRPVCTDLLHEPVYSQGRLPDDSYNRDNIFAHTKEDIQAADIAIINQETILINDKSKISSYPCFGSPIETGDAIVNAGFDVVCHATNHAADKKMQGIIDTCNFWDTKYPDIIRLGIHKSADESDIAYLQKNGITFSFVNYTYGLNGLESYISKTPYAVDLLSNTDIETTVPTAAANSDICIAIIHAGNEYVYEPTKYQKDQINRLIDLGANIVICMHPHVIEPYGVITTPAGNSALVYYSLGNFVSAQNEVPRVLGGIADFTITKHTTSEGTQFILSSYTMTPVVCHQQRGNYTVYKLSDYPDELTKSHRLASKGFSKQKVLDLYNQITSKNPPIVENLVLKRTSSAVNIPAFYQAQY